MRGRRILDTVITYSYTAWGGEKLAYPCEINFLTLHMWGEYEEVVRNTSLDFESTC